MPSPIRERILESIEDAMFLEPAEFDQAIVGVAERADGMVVVAYDRERCIEVLMRDMDRDEAEEFFNFNTVSAWMGELTPVFLDKAVLE